MEAQSRGLASWGVKLRSMLRTESVEMMVLMPSLAASRPASVLLPVPLVPASSTVTLRFCSRMLCAQTHCQPDGHVIVTSHSVECDVHDCASWLAEWSAIQEDGTFGQKLMPDRLETC